MNLAKRYSQDTQSPRSPERHSGLHPFPGKFPPPIGPPLTGHARITPKKKGPSEKRVPFGSDSWIRTNDQSVNSRLLYH